MVEFNISYFINFMIAWFCSGFIALLLSAIVIRLDKTIGNISFAESLGIICYGPIALVFTIVDIFVNIFTLLFGEVRWTIISKVGNVPFKYEQSHPINTTVDYNPLYAKETIDGKYKTIEATFAISHPSYFKIVFHKKRAK